MHKNLVLHIPHSSIEFPDKNGFIINDSELKEEIDLLTDWYTDELFNSDNADQIIAPFSRIYCDVERFEDDSQEPMSKFGHGMIYTNTCGGKPMRKVSESTRSQIHSMYKKHHHFLEQKVTEHLDTNARAFIVDCHSFPDKSFPCALNSYSSSPDINIGTDSFHTPDFLVKHFKDSFEAYGYSVWIDKPFSGSIVPMKYYEKNKSVFSIMIEVNKRLYLNSDNSRNENFNILKSQLNKILTLTVNYLPKTFKKG